MNREEGIMHTPGPWTFFTEREATPDRPNTMKFLKGVDGQGFAHTVGLSEPTDTANARLIAAAPELLEALKRARQWMDDRRDLAEYVEEIALANDVIAKAEGKP